MKKSFIILLVLAFLHSLVMPYALAYTPSIMTHEFLCEIGIKFYNEGRYDEALHEFRKALIAHPNYEPAIKYIRMIEQMEKPSGEPKQRAIYPQSAEAFYENGLKLYRQGRYDEALQQFRKAVLISADYKPALRMIEKMRAEIQEKKLVPPAPVTMPGEPAEEYRAEIAEEYPEEKVMPRVAEKKEKAVVPEAAGKPAARVSEEIAPPEVLRLDASLDAVVQPVEIPRGKSMVILGNNIQRFLVIEPRILEAQQKSPNELLLTANDIGYTYVHVWDNNGRWTLEFLTVMPQPQGPTYEESLRREEEDTRSFKLRYSVDWTSTESGKRVALLERSGYNWQHLLDLTGETPYGKLSSRVSVRRDTKSTDLTYLNLDLDEGQFGNFKGFNLQGFDYSVPFSNLAVSGSGLRGAMIASPAFHNKINYSAFWGREGGGRYGNLSPSLVKVKDSFLNGFNLGFSPVKGQSYNFSFGHGWGRARLQDLPSYTYDFIGDWKVKNFGLDYEIASDSRDNFAHLLTTNYVWPKLSLAARVRDINKNFYSITGRGAQAGEFGSLFNLNYKPTEKLSMSSALDVYRDRLYSSQGAEDNWNEDFNWRGSYLFDPQTSVNASYSLQNMTGGLSQFRNQSEGVNLIKKFKFLRGIDTYLHYLRQDNENYSTLSASYINDKINAGLRFGIISNLYGYFEREYNWNRETYTDSLTTPNAYEAGLEYASDLGRFFYGDFRLTYRNEEDTGAATSFLSGEDYLDGTASLTYKCGDDKEFRGSGHIRDNLGKSWKTLSLEMDFNLGMTYYWDTGIRWESIGDIEGYVFKDLNSDGLRQRDEAPVEGMKVWLGKDKSQLTDMFGYYRFKKVTSRKVYVNLDSSALPAGFVATVPVTQEVAVVHSRTARVDFGIVSRSEITGIVFEDVNGDGEYSVGEKGVSRAVITLENGSKALTDTTGRYSFATVAPGEHTLTLKLDSLPIYYLPQIALTKKITLFEGVSYVHNIPLKRTQE